MKAQQSNKRDLVLFMIGFTIVIISILIFFLDGQDFINAYEGPFIMFACTDPSSKVDVDEFVSKDGTAEIIPYLQDDTILWIRVFDIHKFEWSCSGDIEPIILSGSNDYYTSRIKKEKNGYDTEMIFRFEKQDNFRYSSITINSDFAESINNNICHVRLPWLTIWPSDKNGSNYDSSVNTSYTDKNFIGVEIDGKSLYEPLFNYLVSFPDLALIKNNYDIRSITPEPSSVAGAYFVWEGNSLSMFTPSIQYDVQNNYIYDIKNQIVSMLIGIGLSFIYEGRKGFRLLRNTSHNNHINKNKWRSIK